MPSAKEMHSGMCLDPGEYADLCRSAVGLGTEFEFDARLRPDASVYVCGMGASAIAGEMIQSLARTRVISCQGDAAQFAHDRTGLVIVISYGGETPEARACLQLATQERRGGGTRSCICVTSDENLAELAKSRGARVLRVPAGFSQSRKFVHLVLPVVAVLTSLGAIEPAASWEALYDAVTLSPHEGAHADEIAGMLANRFPAIYGTDKAAGPAVMMWGNALCEVAKLRAWTASVPDLLHGQVCTFTDAASGRVTGAVLLTADAHGKRAVALSERWRRELMAGGAAVDEVRGRGESRLARLFSLVRMGERVAEGLAAIRRVDAHCSGEILRSYKVRQREH